LFIVNLVITVMQLVLQGAKTEQMELDVYVIWVSQDLFVVIVKDSTMVILACHVIVVQIKFVMMVDMEQDVLVRQALLDQTVHNVHLVLS